jgi:arsenate reductase
LDDAERAGDPLKLLIDHPTLMKRPVIDHDGSLTLGWTKDVQAQLL